MILLRTGSDNGIVKFQEYWWWADRGLIHCENKNTGEYKTLSVRQTLERLKALNDMVGNSTRDKGYHRPDEVRTYHAYIEDMIQLCQSAQSQGDPTNVKHQKQTYAEAKARASSRNVRVSPLARF